MDGKRNKYKVVLLCILFAVYLVYSVGLIVFDLITGNSDSLHYTLTTLGIIAIGSLVLISIRSNKDID